MGIESKPQLLVGNLYIIFWISSAVILLKVVSVPQGVGSLTGKTGRRSCVASSSSTSRISLIFVILVWKKTLNLSNVALSDMCKLSFATQNLTHYTKKSLLVSNLVPHSSTFSVKYVVLAVLISNLSPCSLLTCRYLCG